MWKYFNFFPTSYRYKLFSSEITGLQIYQANYQAKLRVRREYDFVCPQTDFLVPIQQISLGVRKGQNIFSSVYINYICFKTSTDVYKYGLVNVSQLISIYCLAII